MTEYNPDINQYSQASESSAKELDTIKNDILQNYLNGSLILGTILFFINLFISLQSGNFIATIATFLLFGLLFLITFLRKMSQDIRTILLSLIYFSSGIFSLISSGVNANAMLFFFIAVLILGILGARAWWISSFLITCLSTIVLGILFQTNVLQQASPIIETNSVVYWVATFVILLFMIYVVIAPTNRYLLQSMKLLNSSRNDSLSLRYDNESISRRVHTLENDLDRRRSHLISGRQIIRSISEIDNTTDLVQNAVDLIKSQFGHYFVGIYLLDQNNEYISLKAASGAVGQAMVARNYRLLIHDEGIIGYVVSRGEPRIAFDFETPGNEVKQTDFPETKSEIAIPLKIGSRVIGVLDIHSDRKNAFSQEDLDILHTVTDQIAISIEKTQKNESIQSSLHNLEEAYSAYSKSSWHSHLKGSKKNLSYQYSDDKLSIKNSLDSQEIEAIQLQTVVTSSDEKNNQDIPQSTLLFPIMLRDQILGVLNIKYQGETIPKDLVDMVEKVSSRLAAAIENARLLEDIQDRAERERVVGSIANRVRTAKDIDSILQTTVAELGRSLGINEVRIQLKTRETEA